jgi:hypothetical protein
MVIALPPPHRQHLAINRPLQVSENSLDGGIVFSMKFGSIA